MPRFDPEDYARARDITLEMNRRERQQNQNPGPSRYAFIEPGSPPDSHPVGGPEPRRRVVIITPPNAQSTPRRTPANRTNSPIPRSALNRTNSPIPRSALQHSPSDAVPEPRPIYWVSF